MPSIVTGADLLRKVTRGTGYLVVDSDEDTSNILCRHGHIYVDGEYLVASFDEATLAQSRAARKLGAAVSDGDFGELDVRFRPSMLPQMARIILPRQAR